MSVTLANPLIGSLRLQGISRLNHPRIPTLLHSQFTSHFHTSPALQVIRKHGKVKNKFTAIPTTTTNATAKPAAVKSAPSPIAPNAQRNVLRSKPKATSISIPVTNYTAENLANLPRETLLYANMDRRLHYGCTLIAVLTTGWVAHTVYRNVICPPPEGLPRWVLGLTYVGGVGLSFVSGLAWWYPGRFVRSIKAIPRSVATPLSRQGATGGGLVLRVERSIYPLPLTKTYDFLPEELILQRPIGLKFERAERIYREGFVGQVMDAPRRLFHLLRDLMDTENIIPMVAKGRKQPFLLSKAGWQWEEGGIDRVIKSVPRARYAH